MLISFVTYLLLVFNSLSFLQTENTYKLPEQAVFEFYNYDYVFIKDNLFYYNIIPDNSCNIRLIPIDSSRVDTLILEIPDDIFKYKCYKYTINVLEHNNYIVAGFSNFIILYYKVDKQYQINKIIDLEDLFKENQQYYFKRLKSDGKNIIGFYDAYRAKYNRISFFILNTDDIKNSSYQYLKQPKGYYLTLFQPKRIVDYCESTLLLSNLNEYYITIHDIKAGSIDTLKRNIKGWKSINHPNEYFDTWDPRRTISFIQNDTNLSSLMHRAEFIDDAKILVTYSVNKPSQESFRTYHEMHDLWIKLEDKWQLRFKDIDSDDMKTLPYNNDATYLGIRYKIIDNKILSFYYDLQNFENNSLLIRKFKK